MASNEMDTPLNKKGEPLNKLDDKDLTDRKSVV